MNLEEARLAKGDDIEVRHLRSWPFSWSFKLRIQYRIMILIAHVNVASLSVVVLKTLLSNYQYVWNGRINCFQLPLPTYCHQDKYTISRFLYYGPEEAFLFGNFGDFESHSKSHRHSKQIKKKFVHIYYTAAVTQSWYNFGMTELTASTAAGTFSFKLLIRNISTISSFQARRSDIVFNNPPSRSISKLGKMRWWAAISCTFTPGLQFQAIVAGSIITPCEARWAQGQ